MGVTCWLEMYRTGPRDKRPEWHPLTAHYAAEECDMTDRQRVIGLLDAYAARQRESQLAALLHNAARMLEEQQ